MKVEIRAAEPNLCFLRSPLTAPLLGNAVGGGGGEGGGNTESIQMVPPGRNSDAFPVIGENRGRRWRSGAASIVAS